MAVVNDDIEAFDAALAAADGDCNVKHHNELLDTPLVLAIQLGRVRMVEHLIAVGAEVDSGTPCKVAAIVGDERIMKMLIQAGANVRTRAYGNRSLCRYAAKNADAGVLRALIEAGASFDDDRPIVAAVQNENEEVLSILLAAGCSLEPSSDLAATAASNCNHNVLAMLMNADIVVAPPQDYDAWSSNDYAKPPTNRTDYEDFTKVH